KRWRAETQVALDQGRVRAPTKITVAQAAQAWLAAAQAGVIRTRSGDRYRPSALRSYQQSLHRHVLPAVGSLALSAVTRNYVQAQPHAGHRIHNVHYSNFSRVELNRPRNT